MDIEKIVVSLIGDTSKYDQALDRANAKLVDTVRRMTENGGKDPFAGMTNAARRATVSMAAEMQKMEAIQQRASKEFTASQAAAAQNFQRKQDEQFRAFAERQRRMVHEFGQKQREEGRLFWGPPGSFFTRSNDDQQRFIYRQRVMMERFNRALGEMDKRFAELQKKEKMAFDAKGQEEVRKHQEKLHNDVMALQRKQAREMAALALSQPPPKPPKGSRGPGFFSAGGFLDRNRPQAGSDFMSGGGMFLTMTAANLAANAVFHLTRAIADAGVYAVQAGAHYEVLGIQLEGLAGSAEKGRQMMSDLLKTAVDTPFRVKDVVSAAKELKAFGFETEEVNRTVKALGDISAATGTPMHRLILAFGQTKIAGRLMGQEMRQFVNSNVPLVEHLAQVMGKTEGQIKKMIENGQVAFSDVTKALNLLVGEGGRFTGFMDRMSNTVEGRWNSIVDLLEIGAAKLGAAFMRGAGVHQFLTDLKSWLQSLNADEGGAEKFGKDVRDIVDNIALGVKVVAEFVRQNQTLLITVGKGAAVLIGLNLAYRAVALTLRALIVWTGLYRSALLSLSVVSTIAAGFSLVADAVGLVVLGLLALTPAAVMAGIAIGSLAAAFVTIFQTPLKETFSNIGKWWSELFDELGDVFGKAWGGIVNAVKGGDLKLAGEIAFAGLELAFESSLVRMHTAWIRFLRRVQDPAEGTAVTGGSAKLLSFFYSDDAGVRAQLDQMSAQEVKDYRKATEDAIAKNVNTGYRDAAQQRLNELVGRARGKVEDSMRPNWLKEFLAVDAEMATANAERLSKVRGLVSSQETFRRFGSPGDVARTQSAIDQLNREFDSQNFAERMGKAFAEGIRPALIATQVVLGQRPTFVGDFNQFHVSYQISGPAATAAEHIQQRFTRGVGEHIDPLRFFQEQAGFIEEARTGLTPGLQGFQRNSILGPFMGLLRGKHGRLDDEQAMLGTLDEFDKLRKFVGDRTQDRTPVMLEGSAAAQETVNRAQMRQTSVMEEVRTVMEEAKVIQAAQLDIQKQTYNAIRTLTPGGPTPATPVQLPFGFILPPG